AIARLAGPEFERDAWKVAQQIEAAARPPDSVSLGVQLLADIRTIFDATEDDGLLSRAIVEQLTADEEKPWLHYGKGGKPLTQNQLAKLLGQFDIICEEVHPQGEKHGKGYKRRRFKDAWKRYLPPPQPEQGSEARERANPRETGISGAFRNAR